MNEEMLEKHRATMRRIVDKHNRKWLYKKKWHMFTNRKNRFKK